MPQAYADAIDDAIVLAQDFLDRAYHELNSTHAVCKRHPSIPIRVYCESLGHWVPLCKESLDVQSIAKFKGGCKIEPIKTGHAFVSGDNNERWYKFDCDNDGDYDDLILWVEDTSSDNENIWVHIAVKNNPECTCDIYLGDEKIIDNAKLDDGYTTFKHRGWFSQSYDLRHATRLMQWYYEDRYAETGYTGWLERANRLKTTMDSIGYTNEFFAPLWNKSNSYTSDDFPERSQYPDYQVKNKWLYNDQAIPYLSHLANETTLNHWFIGIVPQGNAMWDLVKAIHLMNKYGTSKINDAKQLIDHALYGWDGYGIKKYKGYGLASLLGDVYFNAYQSYTTAIVSIACGKYFQLTGDCYYRDICREAIGALLQTQLTNGKTIYMDNHGSYYSADSIGGFLIHYTYQYTFYYKAQGTPFLVQSYTKALEWLGYYVYDKDEYSPILANTETTLICWKALKFFKTLDLSPITRGVVDYNGLQVTWTTQTDIPDEKYYPVAYHEGYFIIFAYYSNWSNITANYVFAPINTTYAVEVGVSFSMSYVAYLKLRTTIEDITIHQEVSRSETLLLTPDPSQLPYPPPQPPPQPIQAIPFWKGAWITIPINYTFDLTHLYCLHISIIVEPYEYNIYVQPIVGRIEGFAIRPMSIGNLTKILRPCGNGVLTEMTPYPSEQENWKCIDEETLDTNDYVRTDDSSNEKRDLYCLPKLLNVPDNAEINSITIKGHFYTGSYPSNPLVPINSATILVFTYDTIYQSSTFGSLGTEPNNWTWTINPYTNQKWTVNELYNIQIGVKAHSTIVGSGSYWAWQHAKCYQLWIEINHKTY